jgi:integrase
VHPKVVQERLGHSSVQITLDVYSHATKGMQDDAAAFIGSLVLGATHESRRQNADISAEVADFSASTDA